MLTLLLAAVNFLLATAMWFVIGRLVMSIFIRNPKNPVWQLFLLLTDPVYRATRAVTGNRVPERLLGIAAVLLLAVGRILVVRLIHAL